MKIDVILKKRRKYYYKSCLFTQYRRITLVSYADTDGFMINKESVIITIHIYRGQSPQQYKKVEKKKFVTTWKKCTLKYIQIIIPV